MITNNQTSKHYFKRNPANRLIFTKRKPWTPFSDVLVYSLAWGAAFLTVVGVSFGLLYLFLGVI